MKNVQTRDKPERGRYEEKDVWEKSSDITTFNLYEQSWADLQLAGLLHLFKNEEDFNRKKAAAQKQNNQKGSN